MTRRPRESWDDLEDDAPPDMGRLSKRELAAVTGLAPKRLDALVRAGMPATPGASTRAGYTFDLHEVFAWLVDNQGGPDADPLALARQRKAEAEAARIETANRKAAGELVAAAEVRREIREGMANLRSELLAIPARLAVSAEVQATVMAGIVAAINAMSIEHGSDDATL